MAGLENSQFAKPQPPHVLIFPLPLQGPISCMLKLAELLSVADIRVTFLNTVHAHSRLLRHSAAPSHLSRRFPGFRFRTVPDGLPDDHPRSADRIADLFLSLEATAGPLLREILTSEDRPATCVVADGIFGFAVDVAEEVGVPIIYFDTISPCGFWAYLCVPRLIAAGEIPFDGDDLDAPVKNVPGTESFLRRRDLPGFCRVGDISDPIIQLAVREAHQVPRAAGIILNTFDELDGPILAQIRTICPNTYAVGPLHSHLRSRLAAVHPASPPPPSATLWAEDVTCTAWLDAQPPRSVVYVSIGSLAVMTADQETEFWHGLVNSGKRFLWVRRPGSIAVDDERQIPAEVEEGVRERGCLVEWAPQEKVLAHPAVGGFLTHGGWNSTVESVAAGVAMVCWPYFVDQQMNSRFVSEVWRVGVDMKDTCDRVVIEKMVREVMEVRREEFDREAAEIAELAGKSVREGGSSYADLDRLIEDIRLMSRSA
ncbi:7-deoxyloganetic acid glucosyl transferase-like [Malania oleifera]|uniref:7-deoxyloganetic acid glucosyl transferase-like n=1 Tax=Malania oleifera TaxID=397392 RepID=UPI0025AE90B3|nr:7-deoxyloganetic acid glucosyl transferase-like [Malania oleifera]